MAFTGQGGGLRRDEINSTAQEVANALEEATRAIRQVAIQSLSTDRAGSIVREFIEHQPTAADHVTVIHRTEIHYDGRTEYKRN